MQRIYLSIVLLVAICVGLSIAYLGYSVPPYQGDQTRLGGFSDVDFGWLAPQEAFKPILYLPDELTADTEVLIVGDSITLHRAGEHTHPGTYWPNYLAQLTGWKISALHRREISFEELLGRVEFRSHPPSLFIFQFAERALLSGARLVGDLATTNNCSQQKSATDHADSLSLQISPLDVEPEKISSEITSYQQESWAPDFSRGTHHLRQLLKRRIMPWSQEIHNFPLIREGLFSSQSSDRLLIYYGELLRLEIHQEAPEPLWCRILELKQRIEANGKTRFLLLITPDKLTVYKHLLRDDFADHEEKDTDRLLPDSRFLIFPAKRMQQAVEAGETDVYLPNDTHPGAIGHRIIAEAVLDALSPALHRTANTADAN